MSRTNLAPTPNFAHGLGAWVSQYPTTASIAVDTTKSNIGVDSLKITGINGGSVAVYSGMGSIPVTAGQTVTFSFYLNVPAGTFNAFYAISIYWSLAGTYKTYSVSSTIIPANTGNGGVWTRYSITKTVPASIDGAAVVVPATSVLGAGYSFWVSNVLAEVASTAGSYFDGDTAADANYTYAWAGTPGASASIATPVPPPPSSRAVNVGGVAQTVSQKVNVGGTAQTVTRQIKTS